MSYLIVLVVGFALGFALAKSGILDKMRSIGGDDSKSE